MITPGSTGLSRDHAHRAPATRVTASRSQLIRALKTRTGAAANPIASHGRLRCTPTRNQAARSVAIPSITALTAKIGRAHVELQSLMRNSYAVYGLKNKRTTHTSKTPSNTH